MIFQNVKNTISQEEIVKYKNEVKDKLVRIENSSIDGTDLKKANLLINKFISCEIIYKELLKIVKDKNNELKKANNRENLFIRINEVKSVFNIFDFGYDDSLLENIFSSKKTRNDFSMKSLRDNIIHNKSKNDIKEAADRYDELNGYMDTFLEAIRNFNDEN